MALETLATGLFAAMWRLMDRKYGKFGEARVNALQKEIVRLQRTVDGHVATIRAAEEFVRVLEADLEQTDLECAALRTAADALRKRVDELTTAANVVTLPENPYIEEVP